MRRLFHNSTTTSATPTFSSDNYDNVLHLRHTAQQFAYMVKPLGMLLSDIRGSIIVVIVAHNYCCFSPTS